MLSRNVIQISLSQTIPFRISWNRTICQKNNYKTSDAFALDVVDSIWTNLVRRSVTDKIASIQLDMGNPVTKSIAIDWHLLFISKDWRSPCGSWWEELLRWDEERCWTYFFMSLNIYGCDTSQNIEYFSSPTWQANRDIVAFTDCVKCYQVGWQNGHKAWWWYYGL